VSIISEETVELLGKAKEAFPWFDLNRLNCLVEAVQETAFQAIRIEVAGQPSVVPDLEREHELCNAILDFLGVQIRKGHPAG